MESYGFTDAGPSRRSGRIASLRKIFAEADLDRNGSISFDEFRVWYQRGQQQGSACRPGASLLQLRAWRPVGEACHELL